MVYYKHRILWENYIHFRAHAYSAGIRTKVNKFVQGIGNGREGIMEDYTTNVNGTAVIGESRVKAGGTKKRGVGKDVFLLVLIVFIAVSVLTGLTVAKSEQEVMPAESAIIRSEESVISFDENGNIVYESGAPEGVEDDPFFNAANIEQDEAGNVTVTEFDGTVTTYESGSIGFGMTEINLDEAWGIAPASPDKMVSDVLEKAENVAYAAIAINVTGAISPNVSASYGPYGMGAYGNQASSGGSSRAEASFAFSFKTGTWYRFLSSMSSNIKASISYRNTSNCGSSPSQGWSAGEGNVSGGNPSSSKNYYVLRIVASGNAGSGKNDKFTAYAGASYIYLSISHNCTTSPILSIDKTASANTWKQTQQVKVTAKAPTTLLKSFSISYPVLNSGKNYSTSNNSLNYAKQYNYTSPAGSPAAGNVYSSVTSYTNKSASLTKYAYQLYIDNGNPVLDEIYFVASNNSTTKINGLVKKCEYLYLYLKVHDTGNKGATSGITTIKATSDRGANYPINMNGSGASNSNSGGSVQAWIKVKAEDANGVWTIQIQDKTTTNISNYDDEYSFYWYDGIGPTISDFEVTANKSDFSMNGQNWTNDSLNIAFQVKDYAIGTTHVDKAEITTVDIRYKVNGVNKSIPNAEITKTGNNVYLKTCEYGKFMFDANVIEELTVTAYDKAGNYGEKTFTPSEMTIKGRLDTVAPSVMSAKVVGSSIPWGAMDGYSAEDVQIQVDVKDFNYSDIPTFGLSSTYRFSNGAGISKIYFYADAAGTKPLKINGTDSNVFECQSVAGQTGLRVYNITIKHDTANSEFEGGQIYFVAEDQVGNRSDGRRIPSGNHINENENWGNTIKKDMKYSSVYLYEGMEGPLSINRDTFTPQMVVKDADGKILASTMKLNGTTLNYVMPWEKVEAQTVTVDIYYGGSGGNFNVNKGESSQQNEIVKSFTTGGTDYNFTGSNAAGTGEGISVSTTGGTSYSSGKKISINVRLAAEGETTYTFNFKNNAGVSAETIYFTTRIDNKSPSVTLVGFSNEMVTLSSSLNNLISEELLLNQSKWLYPDNPMNGLYAVFKIDDRDSGTLTSQDGVLSNGEIKYGIDGESETQYTKNYPKEYERIDHTLVNGTAYSETGYRMEFKYDDENGNVYTYELTGYTTYISGAGYYAQVKMFDTNKLKTLPGLYDSTQGKNGIWNVTTNTYFRYKIGVSDFIGNIGYANLTDSRRPNNQLSSNPEWDNRVLRYYVDPLGIEILSTEFYEINGSDWDDNWIYTEELSDIGKEYIMTSNRNSGWASRYVVGEVKLATGLSEVTVDYRYQDMTGKYTESGEATGDLPYAGLNQDTSSQAGGFVLMNKKTAWVVFSNSSTKDIQVAIGAQSPVYSAAGAQMAKTDMSGNSNGRFYIRQDVSNPIIESIFLSLNSNYNEAKENKLLTFNAITEDPQNPNYYFVLDTDAAASPKYNSAKNFIYTAEKVYVYIKVTDKPGALAGSGVTNVTFGGKKCGQAATEGSSTYYVTTNATYGYLRTGTGEDTPSYNINVSDQQNNSCSASFGHSVYKPEQVNKDGGKITVTGTAEYRALPVVDSYHPYIALTATNENGYLSVSGETASDDDEVTTNVNYFKGDPIKNTSFYAELSFRVGISGLTLYTRRKAIDDTSRLDSFTYFAAGNYIPDGYDYAADGWGYYDEAIWSDYNEINISNYPYIESYEAFPNRTGKQTGTIQILFHLTSVKERIEVLAVSGTGKYYIIELGPLFIDAEAPVIHEGMTLFSVESEADVPTGENEVDYNLLQRIWNNDVTPQYTNGTVYVYYYITDPASGIVDSTVKSGTSALEKVILKNVPVWTINGIPTSVRILDGESSAVLGNKNGTFTVNGFDAYSLDDKAEKIKYKDGASYGTALADLTYYRLAVTSFNSVSVTATDAQQNLSKASKAYEIKIDKTPVTVTLKARTDSSDTLYNGYTGEKYTNKDIVMRWQADYGTSGFGGFRYIVKDNLPGGSGITTVKNIAIPQFNRVSSNIAMTYYERNTGERKTVTLGSWKDGFIVKVYTSGGRYYWSVNGSSTGIEINADVYGDMTALSAVTWEIYDQYLYCYMNIPRSGGNRYDSYTVTTYNTVTDEYAVGSVRPSATATFDVKIDIDKPVIDISSGNMEELMSTEVWHALAKSLRVSVWDDLSGLAEKSQWLDENTPLEDVRVECDMGGGSIISGELIKDEDGLYRAYNVTKSGNYYVRNGLFYIENYATYKIIATDEAGNVTTVEFKPQIDSDVTTVESVSLYKADGTPYSDSQSAIGVGWVADIAGNKVNWTDDYVYALITIRYGRSGYILQYRNGTKESTLGGAGKWTTVATTAYSEYTAPVTVEGDVKRVTLKYEIGKLEDYNYEYYRFRVLSNAQDTELNYYKSYTDSSRARGTENPTSTTMSIELERYESLDVRYAGLGGYATVALGETKYSGLIAIDKITPDVGISMMRREGDKADGTPNYVTYGEKISDTTIKVGENEWSKDEVIMGLVLASGSNFASGNVIYYRSSLDGRTWSEWTLVNPQNGRLYTKNADGVWKESGSANNIAMESKARVHDNDSTTTMSYYARSLDYTISDSRNNVLFEFYTETGAGKTSETYNFGTIDGGYIYGIKVDTNKSEVQSSAAATFAIIDDDAEQSELAAEYNRQFAANGYLTGESAVYTSRNTVIVRLQIQKVGYSGIRINLTENGVITQLDEISYEQFMAEGGNVVYRYYRVARNGETVQRIQLESIAGRLSDALSVYIRIDNTTPIMYVESISGTKATNWGWTTENIYTDEAEYWYTSALSVKFGIGVIENDAYDGQSPYSGYKLEYNINGDNIWIPLNEDEFILDGINVINKNSYKFRITSGAGLVYILGTTVLNNQSIATYDTSVLNEEIEAEDGVAPVTAHITANGTGDYDDGSYKYIFSVDSNDYYYDYFGRVDLGTESAGSRDYDTRTGEFTDYVTKVMDANGNLSITTSTGFKRGDVMELTYNAKYNGTESGANHNYFQNVTISVAGERVYKYNQTGTIIGLIKEENVKDFNEEFGLSPSADDETLEKTGFVRVQFEGSNITLVSYFIAEVEVSYGKDKFYLQTESGEYKTTGTAVYSYMDGTSSRTRDIVLSYKYYGYFDGTETEPTELGAYYTVSSVTEGTGSFRVTKATERKDFILKYFAMDSEDDNLYDINNATDFGFIDSSYYNLKADGTVDETERTYLNSDYMLNADIKVNDGLQGVYRGTFDGNGHVITVKGGTVKGNYGLFEEIGGTVRGFSLIPESKVIISAEDVSEAGILARRVNGGKVEDITVIADVELHNFPSGSRFGGIAAEVINANIGGDQSVFTDIRITNNGRAMNDTFVGGVAGYVSGSTQFNGIYAFGEIEIYSSMNVGAGILYGGADKGTYAVSSVNYFDKNVFINGDTVEGASNITDGIVFNGSISGEEYQSFVVFGTAPVVGGTAIDEAILKRLYKDFGYEYTEETAYGIGTPDRPLEISSYEHILAINGYMNLDFVFGLNADEIDMSEYESTVAVTKVFNGTLTTKSGASGTRYIKLSNFAGNSATFEKEYFGLFGQLNGTVKNIVFSDIAIDFEYTGEETLTAGIVAAKAYENAVIENIILIGTENIRAEGKEIHVGGIVGYVRGSNMNDIFSVNNITAKANRVIAGGAAAVSEGITLTSGSGSVFMLGRIETYGTELTSGSVIGSTVNGSDITGGEKTYAIFDNVYVEGNVVYEKPIGSTNDIYGIKTVSFENDELRTARFSNVTGSAFGFVFGKYYPLSGDGSTLTPFVINNERDFGKINLILYAEYRIDSDITFTEFETIGEGLVFSGVLKGNTGDNISAEDGKIISLINVTAPLVYYNSGKINDLSVNVEYSAKVKSGETFKYGAIAVISEGEIKNVTVAGNVTVTSETQDNYIYVSGFVGESRGGIVDTDLSKLQNSISALNITVRGGGTAYVGGYAAIVTMGAPKFSYGIATGRITISGVKVTYTGLLVGMSHGDCGWVIGEAASIEYTYTITVDGQELAKYDEDGNPLESNFCGVVFK